MASTFNSKQQFGFYTEVGNLASYLGSDSESRLSQGYLLTPEERARSVNKNQTTSYSDSETETDTETETEDDAEDSGPLIHATTQPTNSLDVASLGQQVKRQTEEQERNKILRGQAPSNDQVRLPLPTPHADPAQPQAYREGPYQEFLSSRAIRVPDLPFVLPESTDVQPLQQQPSMDWPVPAPPRASVVRPPFVQGNTVGPTNVPRERHQTYRSGGQAPFHPHGGQVGEPLEGLVLGPDFDHRVSKLLEKQPLPQPPYPPLVNYVPLHQQRLAPPQPLPTQQQARPQPEQEPAPPVRPQPPLQPNLAQPLPNVDQQRSRSVEEEQVKPSVPADLDAVVQGHGIGQGNNFFYGCNVTFNTGPPRRSRSYGYERQREEVHPYRRSHKDTNNIDNSNGVRRARGDSLSHQNQNMAFSGFDGLRSPAQAHAFQGPQQVRLQPRYHRQYDQDAGAGPSRLQTNF